MNPERSIQHTGSSLVAMPPEPVDTPAQLADATNPRSRTRALWSAASSALGAVVGLAPHVLHHVGPLVGTAIVAGSGGTALFGVLGLAATVPMLVKLHRRSGSLWLPAGALVLFAIAFAFSTFVLGPLISGEEPTVPSSDVHEGHHPADS
ncbi:hypothetical protein [Cellulomonas denverensis]|nr:hypothetical protein [Cellulomonas denverensis]GIG26462.1 hypothetical protein Cde04nite_27060 [Cellulomonas denverensis]